MAKLANHAQRTRLITSSTDKHYSLDSEDDFSAKVVVAKRQSPTTEDKSVNQDDEDDCKTDYGVFQGTNGSITGNMEEEALML